MQGDPLSMIVFRIVILPLIKNIKREIPDIIQPWHAKSAGSLGTFKRIETYFDSLTCLGLGRRYYPEPSKSVLIVCPENIEAGKSSGYITDLSCAQAHVILGVTSRTTSSKAIGRESIL